MGHRIPLHLPPFEERDAYQHHAAQVHTQIMAGLNRRGFRTPSTKAGAGESARGKRKRRAHFDHVEAVHRQQAKIARGAQRRRADAPRFQSQGGV